MSLDQFLVRLRQAWVIQRQQIQVILGALCILVCIVCWEKSQWTQPARSDLLHNLPHSAHGANLSTSTSASDKSAHGGSHSDCSINAWSCKHSRAWFRGQEHRWPELEDLADTYCQLDLSPEPEAAGTLAEPQLNLHNCMFAACHLMLHVSSCTMIALPSCRVCGLYYLSVDYFTAWTGILTTAKVVS